MEHRYCPQCRDETAFVRPDCLDGHADCPERACLVCGFAIVVEWLAVDAPPARPAHPAAA